MAYVENGHTVVFKALQHSSFDENIECPLEIGFCGWPTFSIGCYHVVSSSKGARGITAIVGPLKTDKSDFEEIPPVLFADMCRKCADRLVEGRVGNPIKARSKIWHSVRICNQWQTRKILRVNHKGRRRIRRPAFRCVTPKFP